MKKRQSQLSRKKFLLWGTGLLSVFTASRFFSFFGGSPKPRTVKMLSQEGQLVEVDVSKISSGRKIKEAEIHTWISSKKPVK